MDAKSLHEPKGTQDNFMTYKSLKLTLEVIVDHRLLEGKTDIGEILLHSGLFL